MNEIDPDEEPVLLPASNVARLLQISTRTLWRLLAAGKMINPVKARAGRTDPHVVTPTVMPTV